MLSGLLQESLLAVIAFDAEAGSLAKSIIPVTSWEKYYRLLATPIYNFWDQYRTPPKEHLVDLVDQVCEANQASADVLRSIAKSMQDTVETINRRFVLDQATRFVRQQRLKTAIIEAVDLIEKDQIEKAENMLTRTMVSTAIQQDYGTHMRDTASMMRFLDANVEAFPTGIPILDLVDAGPARKQLQLFIAPTGKGKSWWLVHLGKMALLNRLKVVHLTLEMSEAKVAQRYCQSLFSLTKRQQTIQLMDIETDEHGKFVSFEKLEEMVRPSFRDPDIRQNLKTRLDKMRWRNLFIKQMPTGVASIADVEAYLDSLWITHRFMPDLLLVDYADLLKYDHSNQRAELGRLYKELRGLGIVRNIAVATASQGNRSSEDEKVVRIKHVGEDISKAQTADVVLTYSQTDPEYMIGLARLFLEKNRDDEGKQTLLITQNYKIGQFCMSSASMVSSVYWSAVKGQAGDSEKSS